MIGGPFFSGLRSFSPSSNIEGSICSACSLGSDSNQTSLYKLCSDLQAWGTAVFRMPTYSAHASQCSKVSTAFFHHSFVLFVGISTLFSSETTLLNITCNALE